MSNDVYGDDLRLLAVPCRQFLSDTIGRERFVEDVQRILRGYDFMTLSFTLWRVESTVKEHFCRFWIECEEGECVYEKSPSTWRKEISYWSPLKLPEEKKGKPKRRKIGLRTRFDVLKRDSYQCQICGATANDGCKLEVDHKTPKSRGGTDTMSNLWTLCFDCNRGKYTLHV